MTNKNRSLVQEKFAVVSRTEARLMLEPNLDAAIKALLGRKAEQPHVLREELRELILDVLTNAKLVAEEDEFLAEFERLTSVRERRGARAKRYRTLHELTEALIAGLTKPPQADKIVPNDLAPDIHALLRGRIFAPGKYAADPRLGTRKARRFVSRILPFLIMLSGACEVLCKLHSSTVLGPDRKDSLNSAMDGLRGLYAQLRRLPESIEPRRAAGASVSQFMSVVLQPFVPKSSSPEALAQRQRRNRARKKLARKD